MKAWGTRIHSCVRKCLPKMSLAAQQTSNARARSVSSLRPAPEDMFPVKGDRGLSRFHDAAVVRIGCLRPLTSVEFVPMILASAAAVGISLLDIVDRKDEAAWLRAAASLSAI